MKKIILMAAVGGALAAAAPAQAGSLSISIGGPNGGIVIADGKAHTYRVADRGWHHSNYYNDWHRNRGGHGNQGAIGRGFSYIPGTVAKVERKTGGKVTDIVFRNGVYHIQGYGPRGGFNAAKVDPYSGRMYDVHRAHKTEATPKRAISIRPLLADLRGKGYSRFDRVDLKGKVYKVRGLNRQGRAVLLTVDARSGHIRNVRQANRYNLPQPRQRHSFNTFTKDLKSQHYSHFSKPVYVNGNNDWPDHYQVRGRDKRGHNVELRVCAYTGKVLGWRDI